MSFKIVIDSLDIAYCIDSDVEFRKNDVKYISEYTCGGHGITLSVNFILSPFACYFIVT